MSATREMSARRNAIVVKAPAKLNLTLEVVQRLPNGYHGIRSVMIRLRQLVDVVRVRIDEGASGITMQTNSTEIPLDHTNLCHRAASRYLDQADEPAQVEIDIDKAIPVAAGLGGGSSDAAAVLLALNRHFRYKVPRRRLAALGSDIGKDLPFFLSGAMAGRVSGMGEKVHALPALPQSSFLVVNPRIPVATQDAYDALDHSLWFMSRAQRVDRSRAMAGAIRTGDLAAIVAALYNDFEIVAERMHPIIKELKQGLLAFGARGALMSGSGPTVFGLFASAKALAIAEMALRERYPSYIIERG